MEDLKFLTERAAKRLFLPKCHKFPFGNRAEEKNKYKIEIERHLQEKFPRQG